MKIIRHSHPSDLEQFNHVMESLWGSQRSPLNAPMDVYEKDSVLSVRALMPGVSPENLEVTFENSTLNIKGKVERHPELSEAKVYQLETATGTFSRTLRLTGNWDVNGIKATLENGVVTVTVPRAESEFKRVVKVEVAQTPTEIEAETPEAP